MLTTDNAIANSGTFALGHRTVHRMGYGAMQLAGPHVFGPPNDREGAIAVLREAVALGIDHIDTSDFYGPHHTNRVIREALAPFPEGLTIVTKLGARRDDEGAWLPAMEPQELIDAVESNCDNLGIERIEIANLRLMFGGGDAGPTPGDVRPMLEPLIALKERGRIGALGMSNALPEQVEAARSMTEIVCVQNMYNLANRGDDDLIDHLADDGIAYVPFFPLGGFDPLQSGTLENVARDMEATPMQVALAWLLQRSPNILLIPGTSSVEHLRQNVAAANLHLPAEAVATLNGIGS
ncbi:oxidoreductase [Erythrobacter sp. LQ02-29]|uniref:oxidoreductase n=1 Tax=Erythrobacter sp. LQ02-29 TaxID=2920384 RepID=UPI001F4EF385|nr:oxidoreductase [Erythrobacter sp. LQ02-29]MCP9221202.1 oxidoreductase [Erythrobacter sp. LQ02-29]